MYWIFVVLWEIVIFVFSAQNAGASSVLSGNLTKKVIGFFAPDLSKKQLTDMSVSLSFLVRKSAHFISFFILGILMYFAVSKGKRIKHKKSMSFLFCFLYAVFDEIHQYFVPGRACRFFDVCIDSLGSITGILIIFYIIKKFKRK